MGRRVPGRASSRARGRGAAQQGNDEIATALTISIKTVTTHVGNLLAELHARDRAASIVCVIDGVLEQKSADDAETSLCQLVSPVTETHLDDVMRLFAQAPWTRSRQRAEVAEILRSSQPTVGIVTPEGRLVAFVRVLTDFRFKAIIEDLIVDSSMRGAGIGRRLVRGVLEHPDLAGVDDFELYCVQELIPYYEVHGFAQPEHTRFMRLTLDPPPAG